jgi:LmbE family N-acetylglucosaminyl deacetylase
VTHVFVSPHPDDAALSCGGLIAGLRQLGQNVTILTVFSGGPRNGNELTEYQREALGFGSKALWPNMVAWRRGNIPADYPVEVTPAGAPAWAADADRLQATQELANTRARQFWQRAAWSRDANVTNVERPERPLPDSIGGQGTPEPIDLQAIVSAQDAMQIRKVEEERYAYLVEASVVFLDLPDAPFRGYRSDDELLSEIRDDDEVPYEVIRREVLRLEPQMVYFPLGIGGHVDHQHCREAGLSLLEESRRWVMPGPDFAGSLTFYEDFPYAWWTDFPGVNQWDTPFQLPAGMELEPRYGDITEAMDQKIAGVRLYASQIRRLFESDQGLLDALYGYHSRIALAGGVPGYAERYWAPVRTEPQPISTPG